jgi:hypothetical protein
VGWAGDQGQGQAQAQEEEGELSEEEEEEEEEEEAPRRGRRHARAADEDDDEDGEPDWDNGAEEDGGRPRGRRGHRHGGEDALDAAALDEQDDEEFGQELEDALAHIPTHAHERDGGAGGEAGAPVAGLLGARRPRAGEGEDNDGFGAAAAGAGGADEAAAAGGLLPPAGGVVEEGDGRLDNESQLNEDTHHVPDSCELFYGACDVLSRTIGLNAQLAEWSHAAATSAAAAATTPVAGDATPAAAAGAADQAPGAAGGGVAAAASTHPTAVEAAADAFLAGLPDPAMQPVLFALRHGVDPAGRWGRVLALLLSVLVRADVATQPNPDDDEVDQTDPGTSAGAARAHGHESRDTSPAPSEVEGRRGGRRRGRGEDSDSEGSRGGGSGGGSESVAAANAAFDAMTFEPSPVPGADEDISAVLSRALRSVQAEQRQAHAPSRPGRARRASLAQTESSDEDEEEDDGSEASGGSDDDGEEGSGDENSSEDEEEEEEEDLGEDEDGEEEEEGEEDLDVEYDDWVYGVFLPSVAQSAFELLGIMLRDLPLATLVPAIAHAGLPSLLRALVLRPCSQLDVSAMHNYYFALGEALSGRLPFLTAAVLDVFRAAPRLRQSWFSHAKSVMLRGVVESMSYTQMALTVARLLQQLCVGGGSSTGGGTAAGGGADPAAELGTTGVPAGEWVLLETEPHALLGHAPLLVHRTCRGVPKAVDLWADGLLGVAGASPEVQAAAEEVASVFVPSVASQGSVPPARRAVDADFSVPGWLMRPAPKLWLQAGRGSLSEGSDAGPETAYNWNLCWNLDESAPWLRHLLSMLTPVVTSPAFFKHVASDDVLLNEWCTLLTGLARVTRAFERTTARAAAASGSAAAAAAPGSDASGVQADLYWAVARCGGLLEAIRNGWTDVPPPGAGSLAGFSFPAPAQRGVGSAAAEAMPLSPWAARVHQIPVTVAQLAAPGAAFPGAQRPMAGLTVRDAATALLQRWASVAGSGAAGSVPRSLAAAAGASAASDAYFSTSMRAVLQAALMGHAWGHRHALVAAAAKLQATLVQSAAAATSSATLAPAAAAAVAAASRAALREAWEGVCSATARDGMEVLCADVRPGPAVSGSSSARSLYFFTEVQVLAKACVATAYHLLGRPAGVRALWGAAVQTPDSSDDPLLTGRRLPSALFPPWNKQLEALTTAWLADRAAGSTSSGDAGSASGSASGSAVSDSATSGSALGAGIGKLLRNLSSASSKKGGDGGSGSAAKPGLDQLPLLLREVCGGLGFSALPPALGGCTSAPSGSASSAAAAGCATQPTGAGGAFADATQACLHAFLSRMHEQVTAPSAGSSGSGTSSAALLRVPLPGDIIAKGYTAVMALAAVLLSVSLCALATQPPLAPPCGPAAAATSTPAAGAGAPSGSSFALRALPPVLAAPGFSPATAAAASTGVGATVATLSQSPVDAVSPPPSSTAHSSVPAPAAAILGTPADAAAALFRMGVLEAGNSALADGSVDRRATAERLLDGRRWLGSLLWLWRMIVAGQPPPPPGSDTSLQRARWGAR